MRSLKFDTQLVRALSGVALLLVCFSRAHAAEVQGVRIYRAPDNTRLVFDLNDSVQHTISLTPREGERPAQVSIDISKARLGAAVKLPDIKGTPISHLTTERRNENDLHVLIELSSPVTAKSFLLKPMAPYGYRLVFDLSDQVSAPVETPTPAVPEPVLGRDVLIVVDAGHGGEDPGASGPHGLKEKNITLKIAKELANVISQQKGYRAHLTRATDYFIPLQGRSKIAMDKKADLFVSIHADAFKDKTARGSSVFAWSQRGATSTTAKFLADSENLSDMMGGADPDQVDDDVLQAMADMSRDGVVQYSLGMGKNILGEIGKITRLHKHHVEQAGFMVLKSVRVPSLLVETGFISNPQEAEKLNSPDYEHALAVAIFTGINDYFTRIPPPDTYIAALGSGAAPTVAAPTVAVSNAATSTATPVAAPANSDAKPVATETTSSKTHREKTAKAKVTAKVTTKTDSKPKSQVHVVKRGETLSGIADDYGVSMGAIKKRNKMKNSVVWVGQRLKIPAE